MTLLADDELSGMVENFIQLIKSGDPDVLNTFTAHFGTILPRLYVSVDAHLSPDAPITNARTVCVLQIWAYGDTVVNDNVTDEYEAGTGPNTVGLQSTSAQHEQLA